jgi:hypothetical protein
VSNTPRKDHLVKHAPIGLRPIPAFDQAVELVDALERELNAANERIEAINRGNANAERILCELTGCESGRDVPDWIVKKNWELTDLSKAYLELVHKHTLTEERIKRLEHGIAKQNLEIEQTCGRVLDYPWFKDDQKNFPGATEKDGVCVGEHVAETIAAELARKYTEAKQRIKRLEECTETAWGIIANVDSGSWGEQRADWREAAIHWRDEQFHPVFGLSEHKSKEAKP